MIVGVSWSWVFYIWFIVIIFSATNRGTLFCYEHSSQTQRQGLSSPNGPSLLDYLNTYSLLYSFEVISQGSLYTRQHHSLRLFSLPRATFKNNNKPHIVFLLCPLYPPGGFCLLERMATSLPGSSKSYSNRASPSGERFALQRRGFICRKPSNHTVVKSKLWLYQTSRRFGCVPSIVITPSKSPLGRRIRQSRKWCRCCGAYCFTLPYKCERPK